MLDYCIICILQLENIKKIKKFLRKLRLTKPVVFSIQIIHY